MHLYNPNEVIRVWQLEIQNMNKRLLLGSPIDALLDRLYEQSDSQSEALGSYFSSRAEEATSIGTSSTRKLISS